MKKILAIIMISLAVCPEVYARGIYSYEEIIPVSESITLKKVQEFYSDRNVSYSYIEADISDENTSLKLLTSEKGTDILETVKNLSAYEETAVCALNADFFSGFSGEKGFALGIEIKDGELLQSPINPGTMATVAYDEGQVLMSYLDFHIMAVAPNGEYKEVRHLNKHTSYFGDILMYTSDFNGGMSPAPGGEVCEVVIEDGKVTEFRRNMPSVKIPENGCVLVVSEGVSMFLANNFVVGDEIRFDYYITPDIGNAESAFGGGAMLVSDGKEVTEFSHTVSGYHPRSAIGIDQTGKKLYLVAVDGRQENSKGMTMQELAKLMVSLGCHQAVNLDGGGSTKMLASTVWNEAMHTANSPTENRKVINAVGLTYTKSGEKVEGILMNADKTEVFVGHPVKITVAAYDEFMRPINKEINLTSSAGSISGNVFTPDSGGKAVIEATCDEVTETFEVFVVDDVAGINAESHIELEPGKSANLNIRVFDDNGYQVPVEKGDCFEIISSAPEVCEVSGTDIYAKKSGTAVITIKKDNVVCRTSVLVKGEEEKKFESVQMNEYKNSDTDVQGHMVLGALSSGRNNLIEKLLNDKITDAVDESVNGFLLGSKNGFTKSEDENALYLEIDTKKGGIRATDADQWNKLTNAINESEKNTIFILANDSIFGKSQLENRVIKDYLSGLDKNVFVVSRGSSNTYEKKGNVNYFTIGTADEQLSVRHLENQRLLVFDFGEKVTFDWKKIF